jgi:hypothetical protein
MADSNEGLAVVLQASIDHAKELLEEQGGFLPFGARARLDGEIEFLEAEGNGGGEPLEALYRWIGTMLAEDAKERRILAAALVANASLPEDVEPTFETAVSVLVEAPDFCRSIVVPYRIAGDAGNGGRVSVEFGKMIPEEADPVVFAG